MIRRLQLCEDLEHSQCGDVLFNGYIDPPHASTASTPVEHNQGLIAAPLPLLAYQPSNPQPGTAVRPGSALRLNQIMQQTLYRSASQIADFRYSTRFQTAFA